MTTLAKGHEHRTQGRLAQAAACYRAATAHPSHGLEAWYYLGVVRQQQGRLNEAIVCYRQVLARRPDIAEMHNNLGNALLQTGETAAAIGSYRTALRLRPDDLDALFNLGNALAAQGEAEQAVTCLRRVLAERPDHLDAANNLGVLLQGLGLLDPAIACYRGILARSPDDLKARNNLGNALADQGSLAAAADCYRHNIAHHPDDDAAHTNLGNVLRRQGNLTAAVACYRTAIALRPEVADSHHNLGMTLLAQGDWAAGWPEYEWRWRTPQLAKARRVFAQPQWVGERAAGRTLLIYAEQGFGDTLQFCRYAPLAAALGMRVILQVPQPLVRLLASLPGVDRVLADGETPPSFDLVCPMLSLPLAFGATPLNVPAEPYLRADPSAWEGLFVTRERRIGLVWAGNPRRHSAFLAAVDRRRSLDAAALKPLLALRGVRFVSLQKDGGTLPADAGAIDVMDRMRDFADTAALIAKLDLVLSVDTAVAHLAAAMGKPVWLLDRFDPCWRWIAGRTDTPWYPTMRIYRQPAAGDWASVVAAVTRDVAGFRDTAVRSL